MNSASAAAPTRTAAWTRGAGGAGLAPAERARAAGALAARLLDWADRGLSAPAMLLGGARGFVEWAHYPQPDALDTDSGWRFYYHAHAASQRLRDEHGHFHVFAPAPGGSFSHWIGVTLDRRGLPLRLFTTNRWVTDEQWRDAPQLAGKRPRLRGAEPREVGAWLEDLLCLYADEVASLQRERDQRMRGRSLDDQRLRIPSQCRVNLVRRLHALGAA